MNRALLNCLLMSGLLASCVGCGGNGAGPASSSAAPSAESSPSADGPLPADRGASDSAASADSAAPADENPPAGAKAAEAAPPPEETIKALLEKQMWGPPEQGGTLHDYAYRSLKIAPARLGNYLTDGVPANSQTLVFPVKVAVDITKRYTDGSTAMDSKDQSYVFFRDEFGDWTYRFIQNN